MSVLGRAAQKYGSSIGDVGGDLFGMDSSSPPPPPPPPPPPAPPPTLQKKAQYSGVNRSAAGFAGTVLTSPQGVASAALTGGKTLLGQ